MRKIWFVGLLALGLSACEKDDICSGSESETPNVVIGLFDRLDPEIRKSAIKIAATAEGSNQTLIFRSTSTIELPLQINTTETTWNLKLFIPTGSNSDTIHKTDQLRFTYTPEALYVSKACGYKTIFHEFNAVKTTSVSEDTWIRSMNRLTNELTNTDNAHLQFYY